MWNLAGYWSLTAENLAWALIHFVWQGLALGAVAAIAFQMLHKSRPQTRYWLGLGVLAAMVMAPVITFVALSVSPHVLQTELLVPLELAATSPETETTVSLSEWDAETFFAFRLLESGVFSGLSGSIETAAEPETRWYAAWPQLVVACWLAGMLLTSLRLAGAAAWMWCAMARLQPVDAATLRVAQRLAWRLGLRRLPQIAMSPDVMEPLALQWFRPCVLLPMSWLSDVPAGLLEAVLAHELAHIRRHDLWVNLVQRLVETLLFFHPCVWWVSRQIRIERELCCDADAVCATGQPVVYAQALEVVARRRWARASVSLAVGIGGTRMALLNRVKRVLGVDTSAAGSDWWTLGVASVGVSAACWLGASLWTAPVQGQDAADALALANNEGDRPDAPPRREDREDGPPRGERREGEPRPPGREGPPPGRDPAGEGGPRRPEGDRGPRGPEAERGPRGPEGDRGPDGERGPRRPEGERGSEGPRGPRGPEGERGPGGPEGRRPEHRPPHEIAWELTDLIRESAERGQPVPREQVERLMRELQQAHPRRAEGPGRPPVSVTIQRGPGMGPGMMGMGEGRMQGGPPMEHLQDMMHAVRELRHEVERLRAELHEMRGQRPPGGPRGPDAGDGPRGPRGGEAGPPRGPREGEGRRPEGPRDGEGPPRGPRDSDGPRPERRPE